MTRFAAILTSVMLVAVWWPVSGTAADASGTAKQPAGKQETQSPAASAPRGQPDAAKKPEQGTVQSRGLFAKKKKKQVDGGASAGHSQAPEGLEGK